VKMSQRLTGVVRQHTSIPVPAVLDWSDDPANSIGTEFIIMEHAPGVNLHHRWETMNSEQRMRVVQSLGLMCKQMASLQFPAYGSLYFSGRGVPNSDEFPVSDEYSIGPHCGNRYWQTTPGDNRWYDRRPPNRGPCKLHDV
jgi:hypothetical protein